jgi:pseudouridine-5'-phosphate glycosidase
MDHQVLEAVIDEALDELEANNIKGQDVTPYLLNAVKEKTFGQSLKANLGLLKNNASIAAKIAIDLASGNKLSA